MTGLSQKRGARIGGISLHACAPLHESTFFQSIA
jgi:hypothetical protein